jgi:hypothetical protein
MNPTFPYNFSRLPSMLRNCYRDYSMNHCLKQGSSLAVSRLLSHKMKTTALTINVSFEFSQAPNASGRLLAAYEMLFGETRHGDNPFDRTISHPIMPHVDSTDQDPTRAQTAVS